MNHQSYCQTADLPPLHLQKTQEWFATIITNKMGKNDTIQRYSPHGTLIAEEASKYIVPGPKLRSHQRMQIYNQQYWWRLLKNLHSNFPLVTRLFGTRAFNEKIGVPYLLHYPPHHWSLNVMGENMSEWISEFYKERDKSLVLNATHLDRAFLTSFIVSRHPAPNLAIMAKNDPEGLLSMQLYLQPDVALFSWEYDLFTFRKNFLKQGVDHWVEHRFPKLPKGKSFYFVLYRNINNNMAWREIKKEEFILLERFKNGTNIKDACAFLEKQDAAIYEYAASNLQKWLQEWTQAGWLTSEVS